MAISEIFHFRLCQLQTNRKQKREKRWNGTKVQDLCWCFSFQVSTSINVWCYICLHKIHIIEKLLRLLLLANYMPWAQYIVQKHCNSGKK